MFALVPKRFLVAIIVVLLAGLVAGCPPLSETEFCDPLKAAVPAYGSILWIFQQPHLCIHVRTFAKALPCSYHSCSASRSSPWRSTIEMEGSLETPPSKRRGQTRSQLLYRSGQSIRPAAKGATKSVKVTQTSKDSDDNHGDAQKAMLSHVDGEEFLSQSGPDECFTKQTTNGRRSHPGRTTDDDVILIDPTQPPQSSPPPPLLA